MKTIKQITEAFSMQPASWYVGQHLSSDRIISSIVEEAVYVDGSPYDYYVGYDKDNNRLFEFRKASVNVFFIGL